MDLNTLKKFLKKKYDLCFSKIQFEDLDEILVLRNQEKVRLASLNNRIITKVEHYQYFQDIINNQNYYYKLHCKNKILGIGYGNNFEEKSCYWGLYTNLTYDAGNLKIGSVIKFLLYETLFNIKNIDNLKCNVLSDLEWLKKWHIKWGCEEVINKKNHKNVELLLKKEKWKKIKTKLIENSLGIQV